MSLKDGISISVLNIDNDMNVLSIKFFQPLLESLGGISVPLFIAFSFPLLQQ